MDFLPAAASVKDEQNRMIYLNRYLIDFFNLQDWSNKTFADLVPDQDSGGPCGGIVP